MASTSRTQDRTSVQQVAIKALQTKSVTVTKLDGSVFKMFRLQPASSDYFYVLRCRPSSRVRMLRHEEERLSTESSTLTALQGRSDILVPRLIEYKTTTTAIGYPFLISGPFRGEILSDIEAALSAAQLEYIDRVRGHYVSQLAGVIGPAFGQVRQGSPVDGSPSWSRCFAQLLEALLRDAEDAMINIPYDFIRDQVRRHRAVLDQITTPRLTLLEMYADKNAVIDTTTWRISGLLDFSTAIWGDPYMSDCFYQPATSFLKGHGVTPNRTVEERIRQYLYTLYHSLMAVVRQCLRSAETKDEMAARKDLTSALGHLRSIADM